MLRSFAEWIWRLAVVAALLWIGWEQHLIHQTMLEPGDDAPLAADEPDGTADELATVNAKLDAIMLVLPQLKR